MSSVYQINKGVNRSVVFKGLKAQYIWWLGIAVVVLLLLFVMMYIIGVPVPMCLLVFFGSGGWWCRWLYRMNRMHGEHGLQKKIAARSIPIAIKIKRNL